METITEPQIKLLEVEGHSILFSEVIGISPMYNIPVDNTTDYLLYKTYRLMFKVYCKSNTIEIKSNEFHREGISQEMKEMQQEQYNNFWQSHRDAKEKLRQKSIM